MQNKMLALRGPGDSGKTETIAFVSDELQPYAIEPVIRGNARRYGRTPEVLKAVLRINGVLVGLASPGDDDEKIEKYVKHLVDAGCQVIVCATRTDPSKSVRALEALCNSQLPYDIEWIEKQKTSLNNAEAENRSMAAKIVKRLFEIVGLPIAAA